MNTANTITAPAIALAFASTVIEINKKETINGKPQYVPQGKVSIFTPTLASFGISADQATDKEGAPLVEDGLPVYVQDEANWLQGAIAAQVKAQARNKLKPGTAELRDGAKIATNFAELTAESSGTGNAAALQAIRDLKNLFAKWVATLGKSAAAQALLAGLFGNKQALAIQTAENKAKMSQYVTDFAASLDEAQLTAGQKYLQSLLDACATAMDAEDF